MTGSLRVTNDSGADVMDLFVALESSSPSSTTLDGWGSDLLGAVGNKIVPTAAHLAEGLFPGDYVVRYVFDGGTVVITDSVSSVSVGATTELSLPAKGGSFELINNTGDALMDVHIVAAGAGDWGADLMDSVPPNSIPLGDSYVFEGFAPGNYDLRAVRFGGTSFYLYDASMVYGEDKSWNVE